MAKKKLLSEAQVRRFMGLAGMDVKLSSNLLKEMGMYEEEPAADAEMPPAEEEPAMDAEGGEELEAEEPALDAEEPADAGMGGEVELAPEDIKDARAAVEKLLAPLEAQLEDEAVADDTVAPEEEAEEELPAPAPEEPVAAPDEEEQEVMEALSGINLELNEDELVQEVAKRVAKRLLQAKKAQQQLDEALGRRKK
tara:strand:+ start:1621 stop:2208 length:588 start_codon:yes stop_codon:yes gene_type:complete